MTQAELFVAIEKAVAEARIALNNADPADCIDWLTTLQLRTAELAATLVARIQTRPC